MTRIKFADSVRAVLVALVAAAVAPAATFTWDGGGMTTAWSDDLNWAGNVQPANNGTADIVFGPTNKTNTVVNQDWNINSLLFDVGAPNIHFIDDQAAGSGSLSHSIVSELATFVLLILATVGACLQRGRAT